MVQSRNKGLFKVDFNNTECILCVRHSSEHVTRFNSFHSHGKPKMEVLLLSLITDEVPGVSGGR